MVPVKHMNIMKLNRSAFTLLEVLLASIIFVITIAGVFTTLNTMRTPVADKENSLQAAIFGRQVLEALRSQVDSSSSANYYSCSNGIAGTTVSPCPDFALSLGVHQVNYVTLSNTAGINWPLSPASFITANANCPVDVVHGCLNYTVSCGDGSGTTAPCAGGDDIARKVDLTINW